jgi:hypothetical protein
MHHPEMANYRMKFADVDGIVLKEWSKSVKTVKMVAVEFPDSKILYLSSELTESDRKYLVNLFWHQRWLRYSHKILPWATWVAGPPLFALFLGLAISWVLHGFVRSNLR